MFLPSTKKRRRPWNGTNRVSESWRALIGQTGGHLGRALTGAPARGPPIWETAPECADSGRQWDPSLAPVPAYEFDQRIDW